MQVHLDGNKIRTEAELHAELSRSLHFGPHYGGNLAALWDRLTSDVERPVEIIWSASDESRQSLGEELFTQIVKLMNDVESQDLSFGWEERFSLTLV